MAGMCVCGEAVILQGEKHEKVKNSFYKARTSACGACVCAPGSDRSVCIQRFHRRLFMAVFLGRGRPYRGDWYCIKSDIRLRKATGVIFWLLLPPAGFYLLEAYSHNGFDMGGALQLLNIAFFYIFFLILFLLTGKASHSGMIGCLVTMTVGIINYYTVCFRGSPVLPWDMMSVGTALSVSGNYEFAVEYAMLMPSLGFAGLAAVASKLDVQLPKLSFHRAKWKRLAALLSVRLAGIALCLLAFAGIFYRT